MKRFRVHKTNGTSRVVNVDAECVIFEYGVACFWTGEQLVMAYPGWAWKSICEETT